MSEANARQLASRAGKHLVAERRQHVCSAAQRRLLETFVVAARSGELTALEDLLVADVARDADSRTTRVRSMADRRLPSLHREPGSEDRGAPPGDGSRRRTACEFDLAS